MIWGLILGLVQGLTEFLPVSSSGHLVILQSMIPGLSSLSGRELATLDLALHGATLLALLAFFRRELRDLALHLLDRPAGSALVADRTEAIRFCLLVIVGTIPTAGMALLLEERFEQMFTAPRQAAGMIAVTGLLLLAAEGVTRWRRGPLRQRVSSLLWRDAVLIGLAQGFAITPGISRSGATIAMAIALGLDRDLAVRFSFLLAIPAVGGAALLKLGDLTAAPSSVWLMLLPGGIVAAVSGFLAIAWLLRLLQGRGLYWLAGYCLVVGTLGTWLLTP